MSSFSPLQHRAIFSIISVLLIIELAIVAAIRKSYWMGAFTFLFTVLVFFGVWVMDENKWKRLKEYKQYRLVQIGMILVTIIVIVSLSIPILHWVNTPFGLHGNGSASLQQFPGKGYMFIIPLLKDGEEVNIVLRVVTIFAGDVWNFFLQTIKGKLPTPINLKVTFSLFKTAEQQLLVSFDHTVEIKEMHDGWMNMKKPLTEEIAKLAKQATYLEIQVDSV